MLSCGENILITTGTAGIIFFHREKLKKVNFPELTFQLLSLDCSGGSVAHRPYAMCSVQCAMFSVQCAMFNVQTFALRSGVDLISAVPRSFFLQSGSPLPKVFA